MSYFGLPFYPMFPFSLVIFGSTPVLFSILAPKMKVWMLPTMVACAIFYDLLGSLAVFRYPNTETWIFECFLISLAFIVNKVRIDRFILSPQVLGYFAFAVFVQHYGGSIFEPLLEVVWLPLFFIAFIRDVPYHQQEAIHN